MRTFAANLLIGSLTILVSGCGPQIKVQPSIDTLCADVDRYHTTDAQRAGVTADPATWFSLFQWLAGFDKVYDGRCGTRPTPAVVVPRTS